ncbi:hypothetical protein DNTS_005253 [Danionella cerebrum]|uniref:SET domain-containing protein n=1 Tax=Danionella cerebrum TaxID=2873325 RepID=A0A553PMT4_9TELE|nr:hypothetical protein DNTS_005253 [Danionella translucida]
MMASTSTVPDQSFMELEAKCSTSDLTKQSKEPNKKLKADHEDCNSFWFCEECKKYFLEECPTHGPPVFVQDTPVASGVPNRASLTVPSGLKLCFEGDNVDVLCVDENLPKGALFGPYQGQIIPSEHPSGPLSWMIFDKDNTFKFIDGSDETAANWMRFIPVSSDESQKNLSALQHGGQIYFQVSRRLKVGEKLCVWYSSEYMRRLESVSRNSMDCILDRGGKSEEWEEPKGPVLRSAMYGRRTLCKHGSDEAENCPQAKKKKIDLIFKDVLEASLEANRSQNSPLNSSLSFHRARANVCQDDSENKDSIFASGLTHHESSFNWKYIKMENTEEEETLANEEPSTSFCSNCVRLKRRIRELEAEVLHLRGLGNAEVKPVLTSEPLLSDKLRDAMTPMPSAFEEDDQDVDSADESVTADLMVAADETLKFSMGSGRRIRRFKQEWLKKFWFLRYSPTLNEMWCHVCRQYTVQSSRTSAFIIGSKQFKIHTIKLHSQSNLHKKCLQLYKLRMHPEKTEEMCRNMMTLLNAAYHLAMEGRPFSDLRPLTELLKKCDLKVLDQYMNEKDCQILIQHIARTFKEDLAEKIRLSPFLSIIMDGQNDDLFADTVAVYVQFTNPDGFPATEFLSLQKLYGGNVEGYLQAVDRAFGVLGLRLQDMLVVGLGIDGSNISSSLRANIYVAIRKTVPWILCVPVMIHHPHLEVLEAISGKELSCLEELENNLKQLLSFYRYSPRMMAELRLTAPTLAEETELLGDIRAVRWIIGEPNVLNALVKDYKEVVVHLKSISSQTQRGDAAAIALSLLQFLKDYQSVKLIYFLLDVVAIFSRLACIFQGDYLLPSQVDAKIEDTINEIGQLVNSPGEYLHEFENNFRESFNGVDLKNLRVAESKFQCIREKICQQSQTVLAQRFDAQSRTVVQACQVLDLAYWPLNRNDFNYCGEKEILVIFDHLEAIPSSGCERSNGRTDSRGSLIVEWRDLKADFCKVNGFKEVVGHIFRYKQRFPLLSHILQIIMVLPTSSTCCDKGRVSLQKVRRNIRSRLTQEQTNNLLTIAVNGPPLASFDGKRALDSWFEEKSGNSCTVSTSTTEQKTVLHNMDLNAEYYPDI